ncbi:hypothetical protein ILUMI_27473 [Ignelater luminosus]|uniref:TIR domain-containing protein n=1 Tax=Ignelater luminosus TaxID=2038154 RepID=A0A8K0C3H7_IGNLU|nr:hypothetical protein ILUMI_27473 [Ignelater luminosus]
MVTYKHIIVLLVCTVLCLKAEDAFREQCIRTIDCSCSPSATPDHYEFHCPDDPEDVIISVEPNSQKIIIDCLNEIDWNIQSLPSLQLGTMKYFEIKQCPFPKANFSTIMRKLRITSTDKFRFINSNNMENFLLTSHILEGVENVQELALSGDNLENIDKDAFTSFTELTRLEIKRNKINLIPGLFDHLSKLQFLDLSGNELASLPHGIFGNLTDLKLLYLRSNNITSITSNAFKDLVQLNLLELSCNNLEYIDENAFHNLENLKSISLSENKLRDLPEDLFRNCKSISEIIMYRNPGLILPNGLFSNLSELENIKLNECDIINLPNQLFHGSGNIKNITLRMNQIEEVPNYIFEHLKELEELDLSYNKLKDLPEEIFFTNTELKLLNLENNFLTRIKRKSFESLTNLEILNLKNNQISKIDTYAFGRMLDLKEILLANNYIDLNNQVAALFSYNMELKTIDLSNNNITVITADLVQTLVAVEKLDLSYNQISHIEFNDISTSSSSITIDLTYNQITTINFTNAIQENEDFTKDGRINVDLEGNPIKCNCHIYDFINFMDHIKSGGIKSIINIDINGVKCASPNKYSELPITNLELDMLTCSSEEFGISLEVPDNCASYEFRPWDKSLIVDCKDSNLTKAPELILPDSDKYDQIEVHLEGNQLTTGPIEGMGYENVTRLYLFSNNINEISWVPQNIKILELHNNNISYINNTVLSVLNASLFTNMTLGNNPWICDCSIVDLINFFTSSNIAHRQIDVKNATCKNNGKHIVGLKIEDVCPNYIVLYLSLILCIAVPLVICCILYAAYTNHKEEIKVWLFAHNMFLWFVHEEELDKNKKYDAFISYSHEDEEFVLKKLQPVLENGDNSYKLCLHIRDFIPGEFISKQIVDSVGNSRRTIVILSRNFLQSEWGKMEFRIAHKQALEEGRARVILILYGEIDLDSDLDDEFKAYIKTNTYIKWGDPWFWNKLRYALPHPQRLETRKRRNLMAAVRKTIGRFGDKMDLIHSTPTTPAPASTPPVLSLDPLILKKNPLDFTPAEV